MRRVIRNGAKPIVLEQKERQFPVRATTYLTPDQAVELQKFCENHKCTEAAAIRRSLLIFLGLDKTE